MSFVRRWNRCLFFGQTYGWTWAFWVPAAASGLEFDQPPVPILVSLGGIGTTGAATRARKRPPRSLPA